MTGEELLQLANKYAVKLVDQFPIEWDKDMRDLFISIYEDGFMQGATLILQARITKEFK